ncbi:MAG: hypothetical protein ACR2OC_04925 [Solirubrobacterales bacterium]
MSVEAGMKSLLARRAADIEAGAEPVGWKIGLNVPEVQQRLGLEGPVVGYLTSEGLIAPGETISIEAWKVPMIEPEVAIRVGEDGEVAVISPALELVDIDRPLDDIVGVLEGNVFHRGVCFGAEAPGDALAGASCRLVVDGVEERATDELIDAAEILAYVRGFLARHGVTLAPGERIIAGSLTPPVSLEPDRRIELDLGPIGSLSLSTR